MPPPCISPRGPLRRGVHYFNTARSCLPVAYPWTSTEARCGDVRWSQCYRVNDYSAVAPAQSTSANPAMHPSAARSTNVRHTSSGSHDLLWARLHGEQCACRVWENRVWRACGIERWSGLLCARQIQHPPTPTCVSCRRRAARTPPVPPLLLLCAARLDLYSTESLLASRVRGAG